MGEWKPPAFLAHIEELDFPSPIFFFFFWVMVGFEKKWGMGGVSFLP